MNAQKRLIDAIRGKDARRVRAAVAAGASVVALDGEKSALHLAAAAGDASVIEALPRGEVRKLLNAPDSADRTPLMHAAAKGNIETAKALLDIGADVNARNSFGDTALRVAASDGTREVAQLLLEAGADPLLPGRLLLTPLDRARERHTPEGRMIAALFMRWQERKIAAKPRKSGRIKRKSKPTRLRRRLRVK
jgi:hypothetical protein